MKNQNILIMVLIAVIFAGGGFFAGTKYQQSKTLSQRTQFAGQFGDRAGGTGSNRTGGFRGGQIMGEILSVDAKSITVKMTDGSSKIVLINDKTTINKATEGLISDLKVGERVSVFGTVNTDGSVSGENIQLNPIIRAVPSGTPTKAN